MAFFTGLKISLIRDVPFSGVFYPIYCLFKDEYMKLLQVNSSSLQQSDGSNNSPPIENLEMKLTLATTAAAFSANVASCTFT